MGAECLGSCVMFDETVYESVEETVNHGANMVSESAEAAGGDAAEGDGGAGLAEGDGEAGLTDEDESDPTVPFEHGDPVGNFHLQMYAVPPPPPGYKAPPIALRGAGKGHKAPMMVLDGAGKGGKAAPVMLDGAGKGGKEAPVMLDGASKGGKAAGAKAPSVALDEEKPWREAWLAHMRRPRRATKRAKAARAKTWRDCLNGYF